MVKRKYILLAGFLLIILVASLTSAEIIFSDPVTTYFTITPECSVDSECGEDYYENEEYYCKDNAVYYRREFHKQGCMESSCYEITTFQERLIEVCEYKCENGKCIGECVKNEDCKADYYSETYCQNNKIYHDFHDFFCQVGKCIENVISELIEECEYGCFEGVCIEKPECYKNSDCGSATSELICKEDDVYNKITNPACVEGKCEIKIDYKLVEECEDRCGEGECIKEEKKQERNIKEVEEINYCGDYFCDKEIGEDEFNCEEDCKFSVFMMHTEEVEADSAENSEAMQLREVVGGDESIKLSISFLIPVLLLIIAVILIIILVIVLLFKR